MASSYATIWLCLIGKQLISNRLSAILLQFFPQWKNIISFDKQENAYTELKNLKRSF